MTTSTESLIASARRLDAWLDAHRQRGYEPFDGLSARVRPLARGKLGRQVLQQGVRRIPWNLRPWLGITPATSTKGQGYLARAYLKLAKALDEPHYQDKAVASLDWLRAHANRRYSGLSWGNHFDYQSRLFYLPREEPTVVWTALIGHAFLDAHEALGEARDLTAAQAACAFIVTDLPRRREGAGVCISYIPGAYVPVHNANMLAAGLLARTAAITGAADLMEVAREAVAYTVGAQRPDGSWWYGEAPNLRWVDNWHTAYVLDSLWWYIRGTGDKSHLESFRRGVEFWLDHFFLADGTPRYYAGATYPIDIQAAAQAIETLVLLAEIHDPGCRALADRVAAWTIAHMQDRDGHFYYQRTKRWVNRTPMLHWGQSTMLHALASLLLLERGSRDGD